MGKTDLSGAAPDFTASRVSVASGFRLDGSDPAVRVLATLRRELKAIEPPPSTSPPLLPPDRPASPSSGRLIMRMEQRHAEIHELMAQGLTVSAIARRVRLDRKTVRRFIGVKVAAD